MRQEARKTLRQNTNSGYSLRTHACTEQKRKKGGRGQRPEGLTTREGSIRLKAWRLQSQRNGGGARPVSWRPIATAIIPSARWTPIERVGASKKKDGQIASEVPAECRLHGRLSKNLVVVFPPVLGMHFTRAPLHDNEVATWSLK